MKADRISPKILIRSPNWVGDAIMATPVPRAIKKTMPQARLHILAKAWTAALWERHPDVEKIIIGDAPGRTRPGGWFPLIRSLRQEHYDIALLLPNSFSAAWLAFWAGCKLRVGYRTDCRGWLLNRALPWKGTAEHLPRPQAYLNLARAVGADADLCQAANFILRLSQPELARAEALLGPAAKPRIGLAPGSVALSRRWPAERYAQLADLLQAQGCQVVLLGSQADEPVVRKVAQQMSAPVLTLAGKTSLREGLAVIRRMDLVICNDSGALHMAYAQGVPVLVLQGAADPRITGPFGSQSYILRDESLACAPCVRNECREKNLACMNNLSLALVWQKVKTLLADQSGKAKFKSAR